MNATASVIVINFDSGHHRERCLQSIEEQNRLKEIGL